MLAGLFLSIFR